MAVDLPTTACDWHAYVCSILFYLIFFFYAGGTQKGDPVFSCLRGLNIHTHTHTQKRILKDWQSWPYRSPDMAVEHFPHVPTDGLKMKVSHASVGSKPVLSGFDVQKIACFVKLCGNAHGLKSRRKIYTRCICKILPILRYWPKERFFSVCFFKQTHR